MMAPVGPRLRIGRIVHVILCTFVSCLIAIGASRAAGLTEHWTAYSNTATSITGNVTFKPGKISFQNGRSLSVLLVGRMAGFGDDLGESVDATVYRVTFPADPRLENDNYLCSGGDHPSVPVTYIAVWVPEKLPGHQAPRAMAVFSGKDSPRSDSGPAFCGSYQYDAN
jgi:hypothetical protein